MPKRKTLIIFVIVVASIMLFAATHAVAQECPFELGDGLCCPGEQREFYCFEDAGYVVEFIPCNGGLDPGPTIEDGNTVFCYRVTKKGLHITQNLKSGDFRKPLHGRGSGKKIKDIDVLVPAVCPQGTVPMIVDSDPGGELNTNGRGSDNKFGRGLSGSNVYSLENYWGKEGYFRVTFSGDSVASCVSDMGLIITSDYRKWGLGQILFAGCDSCNQDRSQTGAFSAAECVKVTGVPAGPVWLAFQRGADGCDVDPVNALFYFDCDPCRDESCTELGEAVISADTTLVFSGDLRQGCPESVRVRVTDEGYGCIEYTTNSGDKAQQCIDEDGAACLWVEDGCEALFRP